MKIDITIGDLLDKPQLFRQGVNVAFVCYKEPWWDDIQRRILNEGAKWPFGNWMEFVPLGQTLVVKWGTKKILTKASSTDALENSMIKEWYIIVDGVSASDNYDRAMSVI